MNLRRLFSHKRPFGAVLAPAAVRDVLAAEAPQIVEFTERPVAVGTLAQVHRAVLPDGREVAVKIQFPDAADRLNARFDRMSLGCRSLHLVVPGFPFAQLWEELRRDAATALDFPAEARHQHVLAAAYQDHPDIVVPEVHVAGRRLLVTEWVAGTPIEDIVETGSQQRRDRVAELVTTWQLSAPARAGLAHTDPGVDTFRMCPDGRLAVIDFGAVAPYPDGLPHELGHLLRSAADRDPERLERVLRAMGAVAPPGRISPQRLLSLAESTVLPVLEPGFRFDRRWLRRHATALALDAGLVVAGGMRLPPGFLPLLRMVVGTVRLFCRLEAQADYAGALATWLPGLTEA